MLRSWETNLWVRRQLQSAQNHPHIGDFLILPQKVFRKIGARQTLQLCCDLSMCYSKNNTNFGVVILIALLSVCAIREPIHRAKEVFTRKMKNVPSEVNQDQDPAGPTTTALAKNQFQTQPPNVRANHTTPFHKASYHHCILISRSISLRVTA